jgi:hypothetical protein
MNQLGLQLRGARNADKLLSLAMQMVIELWQESPSLAGIGATLLSTNLDLWKPPRNVFPKLKQLYRRALDGGHVEFVPAVEPLAFAIASQGDLALYRRFLQLVIEEQPWRHADSQRIEAYYGSHLVEIESIERHIKDPRRTNMRRANDVARLVHLLSLPKSHHRSLHKWKTRRRLRRLLVMSAYALSECGESDLRDSLRTYLPQNLWR